MPGEEWARRIVQEELGKTVHLNDDGRSPSLYDLRIGSADCPDVAIEVTGAVDQQFTETWNIGPAKGPLHLGISGDWTLEIATNCRVKKLHAEVESLLRELELRGIEKVRVDHWLRWDDEPLFDRLTDVGIRWGSCYRVAGSGTVHLTMPGTGGAVDDSGSALPTWSAEFLRDNRRTDIIRKLSRSSAVSREAFVIVTFCGAPWTVESYLTGGLDMTPADRPDLPSPISGVWVVSSGNGKGVRWDGEKWRVFRARGTGIDE